MLAQHYLSRAVRLVFRQRHHSTVGNSPVEILQYLRYPLPVAIKEKTIRDPKKNEGHSDDGPLIERTFQKRCTVRSLNDKAKAQVDFSTGGFRLLWIVSALKINPSTNRFR
jgi:hypothetical protein